MKSLKLNLVFLVLLAVFVILSGFTSYQVVQTVKKAPLEVMLNDFGTGGTLTVEKIKTATGINFYSSKISQDALSKYRIESFTFAIAPEKGQSYIEPNYGCKLSRHSMQQLDRVAPGDLVVIGNVIYMDDNGNKGIAGGCTYKITK